MESAPETIRKASKTAGWKELMPVQAKTIPYVLAGRDLMVQSRTGSGKTGAFVLPTVERIDPSKKCCQALIMVPTRELAVQVEKEVRLLGAEAGVRSIAVYGGVGYGPQMEAFRNGAHIVVGTPGRVLDHLLRRTMSLDGLQILVFDEADRLLGMGFYPDMKKIRSYLPSRRINAYLFSATFPPHVMGLAGEFLYQPDFLSLSRDFVHVAETDHCFYIVPAMEKDRCLVRIIEIENPTSAFIFCNTKQTVHYVTTVLQRFGYDADELSADLTQAKREKVLSRVRKGSLRFLVATDIAARGIDIPELSHVFLYEPPEDPEIYIHRAGRTGRVGTGGVAISLVTGREQGELRRIGARFGIDLVEREMPGDEDVVAIVSQRVTALLEARLRARDNLRVERMQRFIPLARALSESDEELAVMAMLLDDFYQESLHGPPPVVAAPRPDPPKRGGKGGPARGRERSSGSGSGPPRRRRR